MIYIYNCWVLYLFLLTMQKWAYLIRAIKVKAAADSIPHAILAIQLTIRELITKNAIFISVLAVTVLLHPVHPVV